MPERINDDVHFRKDYGDYIVRFTKTIRSIHRFVLTRRCFYLQKEIDPPNQIVSIFFVMESPFCLNVDYKDAETSNIAFLK